MDEKRRSYSSVTPSPSESPDAEQAGHRERHPPSREGAKRAHLHLKQQRPQRHPRRREEQGEDEADGGGASYDDDLPPADAQREVEAGGDRHAGGRDDGERAAGRG